MVVPKRKRDCKKKTGYDTRLQAYMMVANAKKLYNAEMTVYICKYCRKYKLTKVHKPW